MELNALDPRIVRPERAHVDRRLKQILGRGSVNLGERPDIERLLLMVTRSCELRCSYCFVDKTETGLELTLDRAKEGIDLLMKSDRSRLEVQFFGGEPTRRWDVVSGAMAYAQNHPARGGRQLEFVLTTNGLGFDASRLAELGGYRVMVLFSLDGDESAHQRFRRSLTSRDDAHYDEILATVDALNGSGINWFMNATVPPAAGAEVYDRYLWARAHQVPKLQLNYAVGMYWNEAQEEAYLEGIQRVLLHHKANPGELMLFNWRSDCEPVMLSDDLILDTDGSVLHDAAIFLERSLPRLKKTYLRGHIDELEAFDPLRWDLYTLAKVMWGTYAPGSRQHKIIVQNIRMGAAVDLCIQLLTRRLGGAPAQLKAS